MFSLKRPPEAPIPIAHWFRNPVNVTELRELLKNPAFTTACAALSAAAQPTHSGIRAQTPDSRAANYDWLAGYHDFLRDLEKLTVMPTHRSSIPQEWEHLTNKP